MRFARRNTLGTPVDRSALLDEGSGVGKPSRGSGEHTHLLIPGTLLPLCGSTPDLKESTANFVTCYRCQKLMAINTSQGRRPWEPPPDGLKAYRRQIVAAARQNPQVPHWFTPSYSADTRPEYLAAVADGPKPYAPRVSDERDVHIMIESGRTGARYGELPEEQTPITIARRKKRWDGQLPPFDARTQSARSYSMSMLSPDQRKVAAGGGEPSTERLAVRRVREAIARYREQTGQTLGLTVPNQIQPLVDAGMPTRFARILVDRSAGKFFPDTPREVFAELLGSVDYAKIDFIRYLGGPFGILRGKLVVFLGGEGDATRTERVLSIRLLLFGGTESRRITVLAPGDAERAYDQFEADQPPSRLPEEERRETLNRAFIEQFNARLRAIYDQASRAISQYNRENPEGPRASARFIVTVRDRTAARNEFRRIVPIREHSVLAGRAEKVADVRYRTLQHVALSDLPEELVGSPSSRPRKRKKKAKVRRNPRGSDMAHDDEFYWFQQYSRRPYGARQSIPAARRNPKKARHNSMASAAMRLHHDTGMPLKQAWSEVRNNPRRRDSGMPAGTSHGFASDERDFRFGQHNPGVFGRKKGRKKARNNSAAAAMRLHHDTGMSLKQAWQQVRNNPSLKKHRYYSKFSERALPQYEQIFGAFSTGEAVTHGIQPVNRRNPRRSRGVFGRRNPGHATPIENSFSDRFCCVTGQVIKGRLGSKGPKTAAAALVVPPRRAPDGTADLMVAHPDQKKYAGKRGGVGYCVPSAIGL